MRPLAADTDILESDNEPGHRIPGEQGANALAQGADRVDDRGEPEPEGEKNPEKLADITEKHVEYPQCGAEPDGEQDKQPQQGEDGQERQAGKISGKNQEHGEETEDDAEVEGRAADNDHRQAETRKAEFFEQVGTVDKHGLAAPDNLGEIPPGEHPRTQVDTVAKGIFDPGQARTHHLGKDHGIDKDRGQRIENGPGGAEQGIAVLGLKLPLDTAEDEAAIRPEGA